MAMLEFSIVKLFSNPITFSSNESFLQARFALRLRGIHVIKPRTVNLGRIFSLSYFSLIVYKHLLSIKVIETGLTGKTGIPICKTSRVDALKAQESMAIIILVFSFMVSTVL